MDTLREIELKQAAQLLEDAREEERRALQANREHLDEQAAKNKAAEAARIAKRKQESEEIQQRHRDKRNAEKEQAELLARDQQEAERQLELQRIAQQVKEQEAKDHDAKVKSIREEAFALQQRADSIRAATLREEATQTDHPATLADIPVLGKLRFPAVIETEAVEFTKQKVSAAQENEQARIKEVQESQAKKKLHDDEQAAYELYAQEFPYIKLEP